MKKELEKLTKEKNGMAAVAGKVKKIGDEEMEKVSGGTKIGEHILKGPKGFKR